MTYEEAKQKYARLFQAAHKAESEEQYTQLVMECNNFYRIFKQKFHKELLAERQTKLTNGVKK